ncbi:MAG: hypothetical protein AAGI34_00820 [Pseudomonadota bacterium]
MTSAPSLDERPEAEAIERTAFEAMHAAAGPELSATLSLSLAPVGDGVVAVAAGLPASATVLNCAVGFGLTRPFEPGWIDEAMARFLAAGVERYTIHGNKAAEAAGLEEACLSRGLARVRDWQKFERGPEDTPPGGLPEAPGLETREIGPEHAVAFAEIVCAGFDLGALAVPWLARLIDHPDWRCFVTFEGGRPVGTGALFVRGTEVWTDFGATAEHARGRGVQGSNLATRVRVALEGGATRLHTCTGTAIVGEPQHSYRNIERCGFKPTSIRANYGPL